jgi:PST family polysaccharide transporter
MRVLFPAFSRLQDDNEQLGKTFLRVCGGIALITFPLMAGLAAVAGPFVLTVLGEKWSPIIPLIVILSPIGMIQSVAIPTGRIFIAKGRSDWHFRWTLVSGIVIVSSFISGLPWGIVGVASAYAIVMVPLTFISFHLAFRLIDLSFSDLATALGPYAMATGIMAGAVLGCRFGLESMGSRPHLVLGICVASGFLVYSMIIMIKRPVALTDLANVLPGGSTLLNRWSGLIGRKMKERV